MAFSRRDHSDSIALDDRGLRNAAISLLSRREYSCKELSDKLQPRASDAQQLARLLCDLSDMDYVSDERFSGAFLRSCLARKLGRNRIVKALKEKGIEQDLIDAALEQEQVDWHALVVASGEVKARQLDLTNYKDKQKLFRFLQYRGFTMDEIQYASDTFST